MTTPETSLTVQYKVHFTRACRGRKRMAVGDPPPPPPAPQGRVPRVARLMALAIRLDGLVASGEVDSYADLARLGHVTRARITQILNLLHLAPDIQEAILFLPATLSGRDPIKEWQVRSIAAEPLWAEQRRRWTKLREQARAASL